ncbi:MAG: hypothetical protein IKV97_06430 [Clostridia bacterium]|nr:hypothetical protein [Clostridia bacterium]
MGGKFICGMLTGVAVGAAMGSAVKCMCDKNETRKLRKKARKLLNKVERYVSDSVPFTD